VISKSKQIKTRGFTLIEMIISLTIAVVLLTAIAFALNAPYYLDATDISKLNKSQGTRGVNGAGLELLFCIRRDWYPVLQL